MRIFSKLFPFRKQKKKEVVKEPVEEICLNCHWWRDRNDTSKYPPIGIGIGRCFKEHGCPLDGYKAHFAHSCFDDWKEKKVANA